MKLVSWNVNGLRAVLNKGFMDFFNEMDADVVCLQETKMQPGQVELDMPGYHQYFHSGERKGYSSTAVFTKKEPLSISYDFENELDKFQNKIYPDNSDFFTVLISNGLLRGARKQVQGRAGRHAVQRHRPGGFQQQGVAGLSG